MLVNRIGIINTSIDLTEILRTVFEAEGFEVAVMYTSEIKKNDISFDNFIKKFKPSVIVYDIAIPYEENYKLFCKSKEKVKNTGIKFVLTTTNKNALDNLVGKTSAFEIIGKPFDLQVIISAVRTAQLNSDS